MARLLVSDGYDSGQTGSGKTHTMVGARDKDGEIIAAERGVIPRALAHMFGQLERIKLKVRWHSNGMGLP